MKKSIFSKIGEKIRNKSNNKSKTSDQVQNDQYTSPKDGVNAIDEAKLDEERKQDLVKTAPESEINDTNKQEDSLNKDESYKDEKNGLKAENETGDRSDKEIASEDSIDYTDTESQIESGAENEPSKADDADLKESEDSEKKNDNADDKFADGDNQSFEDFIHEDSTLDESDASGAFDYDFTPNLDYDIEPLEASKMVDPVIDKTDTDITNEKDIDDVADLSPKSEKDTVDSDDKQKKDIIQEEEAEREDNQVSAGDNEISDDDAVQSEDMDDVVEDSVKKADDAAEESKDTDQLSDESDNEDVSDEVEKQPEDTKDAIEESNEVISESDDSNDGIDDVGKEADNLKHPESSESESNTEAETDEGIKSEIAEIEEAEINGESILENIEIDQKQEDDESSDQTPVDDADTDDEEAIGGESAEDIAPDETDNEDKVQDKTDNKDIKAEQTTHSEISKETEALDREAEEDILSEVASSREADDISREEIAKDNVSEPTEELPIISGAMLVSNVALPEPDENKQEPSVTLSDQEIAELSEIESEPVSEPESDETVKNVEPDVSSDEAETSTDALTEKVHEEDVADFFVVPEVPDNKDVTSDRTDTDTEKTEALPISENTDKTDHQHQSAKSGKVIDLSETEDETDTKDKTEGSKKETSQKPKKQNKGKIVFGILAAIVGVLAVCYVGGYFFYQNHFFFGTQLSGVNASNKTVEEVENSIEKDAKDYKLTLKERENQSEIIAAKDIDLRYSDENPVQKALSKQNPFKWPLAVLGINDDELPTVYEYDEAKLNKKIQSLNAVSSMINAENAHPVYSGGQIIIKGMIQGNEVDPKALTDSVKKAIAKGDETLDLEANKIYKNPTYGEDAQEVEAAKKVMEGYLKSEITYTIGEAKEVLGKDQFGPWLKTDESMNVYIDQVQAADWIHQNLGAKYDTAWGSHDFKNSAGQQMKVEGGNYGWEIDEAAELDQLMALIPTGQKNTHEPAWAQTALAGKGTHADIGNTYIEISLGSQHMWCYKDGKLVIDTDVVTGDVNLGRGTPAGVYYIYGMQENATLVGEDYRTPVAYWMPFNGGVGIHDSTWRGASEYGGTTYMGNGSHGCVNTPLDVVAVIFQNADVGEPVVVYY